MDSTSSRSIKRVYVVPTRSPRHRKRAAASKTDSTRAVFSAPREQPPPSHGGQRGKPQKKLSKKKSQDIFFSQKKILQNMNSGLKCRKMVLELFFLLQYSNFGFPIGAKGGNPQKDLAEMAQNGPKWPKIDQNDVKNRFFFNFFKWSTMDKSGLQMV